MRLAFACLLLTGCLPGRTVNTWTWSVSAEGLDTAAIRQGTGDLVVEGDATRDDVELTVELWTRWGSARDEDAIALVDAQLEVDGPSAVARVALEGLSPGYELGAILRVPRALRAVVDDGSGDLHVREVSGAEVRDDSGDAWLESIGGDVLLLDGSGDTRVTSIGGDLDVVDGSGDLWIEDVDGAVRVEDGSGDIHVRDVGSWDLIEDGSGDVTGP